MIFSLNALLRINYLSRIKLITSSLLMVLAAILLTGQLTAYSQQEISRSEDGKTLTITDAPEMRVYAFSKDVIITKTVKEVFVWGGNIYIEGRVEGDVAVIGGSIIQKEHAYIGGAVIVFGGEYKPESREPLRQAGKETIMFGAFEQELKSIADDPSQLFAPQFTTTFFVQRVISILFWFLVTLGITIIAPGAVSRAIVKLHLGSLKVIGLGLAGLIIATLLIILSLGFLPDYISAFIGLTAVALLVLAYMFGRVVLQVAIGKIVQKHISKSAKGSEALAVFIGVVIWTIFLSIPYIWPLAVLALFSAGIGLIITARSGRTKILAEQG